MRRERGALGFTPCLQIYTALTHISKEPFFTLPSQETDKEQPYNPGTIWPHSGLTNYIKSKINNAQNRQCIVRGDKDKTIGEISECGKQLLNIQEQTRLGGKGIL